MQRDLQIRRILDARFGLSALENSKTNDPQGWRSRRNDMGRGIYAQAMRELRRLQAASRGELDAELAALTPVLER